MITGIQIGEWINNPVIEDGWETDYWKDAEVSNPFAKNNPDLVFAFLWIRENAGIIKTDQHP